MRDKICKSLLSMLQGRVDQRFNYLFSRGDPDYKELAFKWKEFNGIITTIINTVLCFNSMLIKIF